MNPAIVNLIIDQFILLFSSVYPSVFLLHLSYSTQYHCLLLNQCHFFTVKNQSANIFFSISQYIVCSSCGLGEKGGQILSFCKDNWTLNKVENMLKGSLDSIPSPSPSVKIQVMGRKVCLKCKGKTLLGVVNKLFCTKNLLTTPSNVWPKK